MYDKVRVCVCLCVCGVWEGEGGREGEGDREEKAGLMSFGETMIREVLFRQMTRFVYVCPNQIAFKTLL